MSTIPKFASNKKYWQILNKLVFGDEVLYPRCRASLQENYCNKYLQCKLCRKKYRPTSYRASWLYGMKLNPRQLFILLYCWQTKRSTETSYLLAGVSYTTALRWFARFRKQLPGSSKLTAMLEGVVQVDESYFLVRGDPNSLSTSQLALKILRPGVLPYALPTAEIDNRLNNLFRTTSQQAAQWRATNGGRMTNQNCLAMPMRAGTIAKGALPVPTKERISGA